MTDILEWYALLKKAIDKRYQWLSDHRLPEMKIELGCFRTMYATLYRTLLQTGAIPEEPYKSDLKANGLDLPDNGPINDQRKREVLGLRFAKYDNLLEYLASNYVFSLETLTPDKLRSIHAILFYVDWRNLSVTAPAPMTQALAEIIANYHRTAGASFVKNLATCLAEIEALAKKIEMMLTECGDYHREAYKWKIRNLIIERSDMPFENIKKRFFEMFPGTPYYPDLVEELITEDYSPTSPVAQQNVLKKLAVGGEKEVVSPHVVFRTLLIEALNALGSTAETFDGLISKLQENHEIYLDRKKTVREILKEFFAMLFNITTTAKVYTCDMNDTNGNRQEVIDYDLLVDELSKKVKFLKTIAYEEDISKKLKNKEDSILLDHVNQNLYDTQHYHRLLSALDDFFKAGTDPKNRSRIRGMKPELSTIKSAIKKASDKKEDYLLCSKTAGSTVPAKESKNQAKQRSANSLPQAGNSPGK
jgi:hypothetical protein